MIRLKRNHFILLFLSITTVFTLFQLVFVYDLKQPLKTENKNPKIALVNEFQEFKQIKHDKKTVILVNHTQLNIPLDSNNNPKLCDILPFYHRFNHFDKFEKVVIIEKISDSEKKLTDDATKFLSIEQENRFINSEKLENNRVILIRGIENSKQKFYQPDAYNYFKCIDSNVILKFNLEID